MPASLEGEPTVGWRPDALLSSLEALLGGAAELRAAALPLGACLSLRRTERWLYWLIARPTPDAPTDLDALASAATQMLAHMASNPLFPHGAPSVATTRASLCGAGAAALPWEASVRPALLRALAAAPPRPGGSPAVLVYDLP